jgi:RNA polymerase sigma factor (sigma-70 family)
MAVKNGGSALKDLSTLFNVGVIGALTDGQLLERFAAGRGEARELAFAALVERHGPFVLRVCRAVLRDEHAAHDAFQATFLALARKAASLWARDSLAPWLHQVAYRAACHDRSAAMRRHSHERAAAAHRPEQFVPRDHRDRDILASIIHQEIDRLPNRYRVAVVLCDLEGRTHEQAARHLGCAVGTVKSRLARGRKRLRGRLIRRGVAPATALAAAHAATTARAIVPTALAESTVVCAATAGAVPASVAVITQGVLISMLLSKLKMAMTAAAIVTAVTAGAVAVAQQGTRPSNDAAGQSERTASPAWTYQILASRDGGPPRKVAVVELTDDAPIRVDAPGALILFQPKRTSGSATAPRPDPFSDQNAPNGQSHGANPANQPSEGPPTVAGEVTRIGPNHRRIELSIGSVDGLVQAARERLSKANGAGQQSIQLMNGQKPTNENPNASDGQSQKSSQTAAQNPSAQESQSRQSSQKGAQNQNPQDSQSQKSSQSAAQNQTAPDQSGQRGSQSAAQTQTAPDQSGQKGSQSAAEKQPDKSQQPANAANSQGKQPSQQGNNTSSMMRMMMQQMGSNPNPNNKNSETQAGNRAQLAVPSSPDTNHRLDQLEKKVDLILEALKAMGRPSAGGQR